MSGLLTHFKMPWMTQADRAISDVEELGYAFVITGAPGSGKTRFCAHLQTIRKHRPGSAHYYLLNPGNNPVTALQAVSDSVHVQTLPGSAANDRASGSQQSNAGCKELGLVTRNLVEKIKAANISLLILDRIDRVCVSFFPAIFQVLDALRTTDHRFGLVLTADRPHETWPNRAEGYLTFVYSYFHIQSLSPIYCAAVLEQWCNGTEFLTKGLRAKEKDPAALKIAQLIHQVTGGNFRDLEQVAHRKNRYFDSEPFSVELITKLQQQLPTRFADGPGEQAEFKF